MVVVVPEQARFLWLFDRERPEGFAALVVADSERGDALANREVTECVQRAVNGRSALRPAAFADNETAGPRPAAGVSQPE